MVIDLVKHMVFWSGTFCDWALITSHTGYGSQQSGSERKPQVSLAPQTLLVTSARHGVLRGAPTCFNPSPSSASTCLSIRKVDHTRKMYWCACMHAGGVLPQQASTADGAPQKAWRVSFLVSHDGMQCWMYTRQYAGTSLNRMLA